MKFNLLSLSCLIVGVLSISATQAQMVDYSVVSVPEESGLDVMQITSASDYVCMPIVKRSKSNLNWLSNRIIGVSQDGANIAYLSYRNDATNIFIKELGKQGGSVQRTNRKGVIDFTYSPDGKQICFSEDRGSGYQVFVTDASNGYVCRQITSSNQDYSPIYTGDMSQILFARAESNGMSIWGYNLESNFLSSYTSGMNPFPIDNQPAFLCVRTLGNGRSEIWRINYATGVEECIVSDPTRSFTTPSISPDGEWILFVGESVIETEKFTYRNTDIYACRMDGTHMMQITYHAADDLSPVWSRDGKHIYFISARGSATATANIWRAKFMPY